MPIETPTHLLLEGKDVWNKGRESQNFQPYFSFEDFYEKFREAGRLDHNGRVRLSSYNLADAIFHGTNLSQVDFLHADLRRSQFNGVSLAGTNFSQADLTDARFSVGYLGDADFSSAILKNTDIGQDLTYLAQNSVGRVFGKQNSSPIQKTQQKHPLPKFTESKM